MASQLQQLDADFSLTNPRPAGHAKISYYNACRLSPGKDGICLGL